MSLNRADKKNIAFYSYSKSKDSSVLNDGKYDVVGIGDTVLKANLYSYLQEEHMVQLHEYAHMFNEDYNSRPSYFMIPATTVGVSIRGDRKSRVDVFNNPNKSFLQRKVNFHKNICSVVYEISDVDRRSVYNDRIAEVVQRVTA